jgi:hypothetical protein
MHPNDETHPLVLTFQTFSFVSPRSNHIRGKISFSTESSYKEEREREGKEFDDTFISASIVEFPSPFVGWQINDDPDI